MTAASLSSVGNDADNAATATDHLLQLLDRQLQLYERLDQLSREQGPLVVAGETQALLELLSRRNRLVEEQVKVGGQLKPYRKVWDRLLGGMDAGTRGRVEKMVAESERLLARILAQDNQDRQAMERAKQVVGTALGRTTHAGSAVRAYTSTPGQTNNRYTNRQG